MSEYQYYELNEYLEGVLGQEVDLVRPDAMRPRRSLVMEYAIRVA